MGTRCSLVLQGEDAAALEDAATAAFETIARLEDVASNWSGTSELARFNAEAAKGTTVVASPDLYDVLARATAWSVRTHGAFDATVEPLTRAYDLRGKGRIPAESERFKAAALVRGPAVTLDAKARTVILPAKGMAFDLGGIGKGWAIDRAVETLKSHGVKRALVNFGGQVYALGAPVGADGWTVEIASPSDRSKGVVTLQLKDRSLSTSAASERSVDVAGTTLNHILDPVTGRPAAAWGSASAIAASATDADCASTALYVMGAAKGLAWAQGQADLEAVFLTPDAQAEHGVKVERTGATVALFAAAPATALAQNDGTAGPSAQELARRIDVLAGEVDDLKVGESAQPAGESHVGLGPAAYQPHHPVAHPPLSNARPYRLYLAGVLQPRNVGRPARRCSVVSPALDDVRPVQPGRVHPDPDVIRPDLGFGHLTDGDDFGPTGPFVNRCAHRARNIHPYG